MTDAVARAAAVPVAQVRRAVMLRGSLRAVAARPRSAAAATRWRGFGLQVGRPLKPMLAASAPSIEEALAKIAPAGAGGAGGAADTRADGGRVEARRHPDPGAPERRRASGCSPGRSTTSPPGCPRWWRRWRSCRCATAVFDGELIALRPDGRPLPFQDTAARAASEAPAEAPVPLSVFLFDVLHLDGADLIDLPDAAAARRAGRRRARRTADAPAGHGLEPARRPRSSATRSPTATRAWWSSP